MGHPKRRRKTYEKPRRPWETKRIVEERELMERYGLKNKKEIWRAASEIKRYLREIRKILAETLLEKGVTGEKREAILNSLMRRGILKEGSKLEDALAMSLDDILERRLQTMVYKMELSKSVKQARQLIVHGHIAVNGRRVTIPSYIVKRSEEDKIGYYDPNYGHNTG